MIFKVRVLEFAFEQIQALDEQSKRIISDKIRLIKQNPYRFKRIYGFKLQLFRVRLKVKGQQTRLIYAVVKPDVIVICLLDRGKDYRDLGKHIKAFIQRKQVE